MNHLPDLRPRLCEPLACALVGMSQAVSAQQRAIAAAMPLATKQQSKIQHPPGRGTCRLTPPGANLNIHQRRLQN
jgi:hypothetical protein